MKNTKNDAGITLPANLNENSTRGAQPHVVRLTEKEIARIERVTGGGILPEVWALKVILDVLELEEGEAEEQAAKN